ncbi:uncharacterized protein HMPREF1541_06016 [Cyphellophora europaea CBS 101466]|uniref:Phosphoglycerate mutase n=1 Tax=Cyphellophora europaea (strain CBS 101466) TaxID=1220924 RepID=W2RTZ3_CYPE1|nr:uncharacterized protein HMPREF1541_06016 [Cyphellophora europaea CBS 101466]ETN39790.1 hypothetical protein HMPREF1541_06016 [Cyphellophora europaea CBS 101466]
MPSAIIHCVRHAQGFHNLGTEFHALRDPRLTPAGEEQCAALQAAHFPGDAQRRISLITASPLTRTLHTAYLTFQPLLDPSHSDHVKSTNTPTTPRPNILALPDAQETSDFPCDTGSDPTTLAASVSRSSWPVDLSLLHPSWTEKGLTTRYSPHAAAIKSRARATRQLLRQKARELVAAGVEKPEIVLVTHGGFLHYFTGDWEGASRGLGTGWANCETRAYEFEGGIEVDAEDEDEDEARIVETRESRRKRGVEHAMPGWEEQVGLEEETMVGWESRGLQRPDRIGEGWEWKSGAALGGDDAATEKEKEGNMVAAKAREVDGAEVEAEANKGEELERGVGVKVQA